MAYAGLAGNANCWLSDDELRAAGASKQQLGSRVLIVRSVNGRLCCWQAWTAVPLPVSQSAVSDGRRHSPSCTASTSSSPAVVVPTSALTLSGAHLLPPSKPCRHTHITPHQRNNQHRSLDRSA